MGKAAFLSLLKTEYLIPILILLTSPWTWRILEYNVLLLVLLVFITFIFLNLLSIKKISIILFSIFILLSLVVISISLKLGFDNNLNKQNVNEQKKLNERHIYYSEELGKIFLNKYSLNFYKNYNPILVKYQSNLFSTLDLNLYFFASHPRERGSVSEFSKFPFIYLIFFILGLIYSFHLRFYLVILYLAAAVLVSGLISPAFVLGPFIFLPFVTCLISLGVIWLFKRIKKI